MTSGQPLADLVAVMDRLRRECPWTSQQTHDSLAHYLLEEAHETLEAIDAGTSDHLREELGDLLLQVVFHARIAAEVDPEMGGFDIDDVATALTEKLIRRNPHVFADGDASTPEQIDAAWQQVKASEKQRTSVHDGIPATLPALTYADKVLGRLGDPDLPDPDNLGTRLLHLVAEARAAGIDPEAALRRTTRSLGGNV